ncbi:cell wall metabolism sensor histidine kinase WalK [uncultured Aeromicrobium sp.]|uniref:sensor histidine kinase n=1 Tax=uncultured Aeromicrobium sp. TaxID=337820 RepID=UPI0025F08200|nr:ATP-binding protein [uncultured Aeromicrobium sp.]
MSSLRARITLGATLVVAVVLVLGAVLFTWSLERLLIASTADAAERSASALARDVDDDDGLLVGVDDDDLAQLLSFDGTVLASNSAAAGLGPITSPDRDQRIIAVEDEQFVVVTASTEDGVLALGVSLEEVEESVATTQRLLWLAVPALLVLVAGVTWLTVSRALRPVDRMRAEVEQIDAAELGRRVPVPPGRDELGRLARTMNAMLDRLESASQQQRRFISDASHELRSPIAAMRQHAEVAQRYPDRDLDLPTTVIAETERLQGLVSAMLVLARSDEHGLALRREPVDVDDLAFAELGRLRSSTTLTIDGSAISPARTQGDLRLLGQVFRNLADNAARHARHTVAFSVREDAGAVIVSVDDDGDGIDVHERERVFERFVRLDEGRARDGGGSGLGLAIVAEVVRAHGGDVWVEDSPLGGARFTLRLPA